MFIDNNYYSEYQKIMMETSDVGEVHHIIPVSMGGSDDKENKVKLSLENHYKSHCLLPFFTKGVDKEKMVSAWWMMSNMKKRSFPISPEEYSILKTESLKNNSIRMRKFFDSDQGKLCKEHFSEIFSGEGSAFYKSKWYNDGDVSARVQKEFFLIYEDA